MIGLLNVRYFLFQITVPEGKATEVIKQISPLAVQNNVQKLHSTVAFVLQFRIRRPNVEKALQALDLLGAGTVYGMVDVIPLIFTMPGYLNDQLNQEKEEEKKAMKNTPLKIEKIFTPGSGSEDQPGIFTPEVSKKRGILALWQQQRQQVVAAQQAHEETPKPPIEPESHGKRKERKRIEALEGDDKGAKKKKKRTPRADHASTSMPAAPLKETEVIKSSFGPWESTITIPGADEITVDPALPSPSTLRAAPSPPSSPSKKPTSSRSFPIIEQETDGTVSVSIVMPDSDDETEESSAPSVKSVRGKEKRKHKSGGSKPKEKEKDKHKHKHKHTKEVKKRELDSSGETRVIGSVIMPDSEDEEDNVPAASNGEAKEVEIGSLTMPDDSDSDDDEATAPLVVASSSKPGEGKSLQLRVLEDTDQNGGGLLRNDSDGAPTVSIGTVTMPDSDSDDDDSDGEDASRERHEDEIQQSSGTSPVISNELVSSVSVTPIRKRTSLMQASNEKLSEGWRPLSTSQSSNTRDPAATAASSHRKHRRDESINWKACFMADTQDSDEEGSTVVLVRTEGASDASSSAPVISGSHATSVDKTFASASRVNGLNMVCASPSVSSPPRVSGDSLSLPVSRMNMEDEGSFSNAMSPKTRAKREEVVKLLEEHSQRKKGEPIRLPSRRRMAKRTVKTTPDVLGEEGNLDPRRLGATDFVDDRDRADTAPTQPSQPSPVSVPVFRSTSTSAMRLQELFKGPETVESNDVGQSLSAGARGKGSFATPTSPSVAETSGGASPPPPRKPSQPKSKHSTAGTFKRVEATEFVAERFVVRDAEGRGRGKFWYDRKRSACEFKMRSADGRVTISIEVPDKMGTTPLRLVFAEDNKPRILHGLLPDGTPHTVLIGPDGRTFCEIKVDENNSSEMSMGFGDTSLLNIRADHKHTGINPTDARLAIASTPGFSGISCSDDQFHTRASFGYCNLANILSITPEGVSDVAMLQLSGHESSKSISSFPEATLSVIDNVPQIITKRKDGGVTITPPLSELQEGEVKGMLLNIEKNGAILGVIGEDDKPKEFKAYAGMFKKQ